MTNEELARLDRWAAKAMGWALASNGEWVEGDPESPTDFPMYCTSESGLEDPEGVWEIWRPTRNPDQAHMVRRWMERKGWNWTAFYRDGLYTYYFMRFDDEKVFPIEASFVGKAFHEQEGVAILLTAKAAMGVSTEIVAEEDEQTN